MELVTIQICIGMIEYFSFLLGSGGLQRTYKILFVVGKVLSNSI